MPSKRKKLDIINELLDKAESSIINPQKSSKTYRYLGEAYTLLCDIVDWRDDTARRLDDLTDNLEEYYENNFDKENEQCFDFLADEVSEISSTIAGMSNYDDSDHSESDDSSDSFTFSNSDEDTIDSEDFIDDLPMIYEAPQNPYGDKCSLQHLRVKDNKVPTQHQESHYGTIHAALIRTSKQGVEKYRWPVGSIHHHQRITVNHQSNNQGNTLVVDLSFSIKAMFDGNEQPFTICFPLKIPKWNRKDTSNKSGCYNFSDVSTDNQTSLQNLQTLSTLYARGRQIRGINQHTTHGTQPKYDNSSSDKQFIYHTEQTLSVYLCQAEVAEMILDRLIAEIRVQQTNLPLGALLKIYHVALHLHSDKTPCGPCEFTLLGLQNTWRNNGLQIKGFTEYFEDALSSRQYDPGSMKIDVGDTSVSELQIHTQTQNFERYGLFEHQPLGQEEVEQLFKENLPEDFALGVAIGDGDCFYDAVAEELNQLKQKEGYSAKSLRLLCGDYAVEIDKACNHDRQHENNWLGSHFKDDEAYHHYIANVRYTAKECEQGLGLKNHGLAVWGEQHIDAVIICKKLDIKIHIIEVQDVFIDKENKQKKQMLLHRLANNNGSKSTNDIDYKDENTVHLAVYNLHFVPVSKKEVTQKLNNYSRKSSQHHEPYKQKPSTYFNFTFPGKNKDCSPIKKGMRMFTLFSAEKCDGTHQKAPVAKQPVNINDREESVIETRDRSSSRYLSVVNFGTQLPEQIWKNEEPDTSQRTTFLSGSNKTPESGKTVSKIGQIREEEEMFSDVSGFFYNNNFR